jgi:hypothetical protein
MFSNVGDTDKVALVIKNYGKVGGMSQFVHSQLLIDKFVKKDSDLKDIVTKDKMRRKEPVYYLRGPMGKGL